MGIDREKLQKKTKKNKSVCLLFTRFVSVICDFIFQFLLFCMFCFVNCPHIFFYYCLLHIECRGAVSICFIHHGSFVVGIFIFCLYLILFLIDSRIIRALIDILIFICCVVVSRLVRMMILILYCFYPFIVF